jgi:hypothetical protein
MREEEVIGRITQTGDFSPDSSHDELKILLAKPVLFFLGFNI